MPGVSTLLESVQLLGQPERVVELVLDDLAIAAPRVHFGVALLGSERALTMSLSRARIGHTAADFENHAHHYARSGVRWNRWAVGPEDRRVVSIERMPREVLGRFWSTHGIHEHRRLIVSDGPVGLAWIGASVIDDHRVDRETWDEISRRMLDAATLLRSSHRLTPSADATPTHEEREIVAYLSPDGTVLAQKDATYTSTVKLAADRLADRQWSEWRFDRGGSTFELTPATELQDHGGFVLSRLPGDSDRHADQEFLAALRRGLTNREIALVLGTTPTAVKKRLERLYARHHASNRVELLHVLDDRTCH